VTSEEATALFQMRCTWESYNTNLADGVWSACRYNDGVSLVRIFRACLHTQPVAGAGAR
jgi:hypothetical protein